MKIKVADLKDEKLAEWTARAQGWTSIITKQWQSRYWWRDSRGNDICRVDEYRPDSNGGQAMELVKKFLVDVLHNEDCAQAWACLDGDGNQIENTIDCFAELGLDEIAICRAVVASVYGEYVDETNP